MTFFSLPARRLLAGTASALLLFCQTAMAAQACGPGPAVAAKSAPSAHCHGAALQSGDESGNAQQQNCMIGYAGASFATLDAPHAADLPALAIAVRPACSLVRDSAVSTAIPARAESPPLTILHCCLRN